MVNVGKWSLSRVNGWYRMTRIYHTGQCIEDRPLTILETAWFWITGRLKKYYKLEKNE